MFYQSFDIDSGNFFQREHKKNHTFPQHLHNNYELIILLDGEMSITIDDSTYLLKATDAVLIFPNQLHSLESTSSEHVLFIFSSNFVKAFYEKTNGSVPENNKFKISAPLLDLILNLDETSSKIEKKGVLYTMCAHFDKNAAYKPAPYNKNNILFEIFSFVEQNYTQDCTLSQLSKALNYEYTYLSRFFKKSTGISYDKFVNKTRMDHACYLLYNTQLSILECSEECGFKSLRSFNRNFKSSYNMTPGEYRKLHKHS